MESVGPSMLTGGMVALTRLPSGSRASSIGDEMSMRRPTRAAMRSMTRTTCSSSRKRTSVLARRPNRSTHTLSLPLTRMSVTAGSAISGASGPTPSVSSVNSPARRSRSSAFRGRSSVRRMRSTNCSTAREMASSPLLACATLSPISSSNRPCRRVLIDR
jgi:hypothetical protein